MIASVQGVLDAIGPDFALVNVGGVSLQVFVPTSTLANLGPAGRRVVLYTHLYFKEDTLALYGFLTPEEQRLFRMLLNVGGIGPKTAMSALSVMSPSEFATAVAMEDLTALSRIPGVGRKTAARITLELKGTLEKEWSLPSASVSGPADADAVAALVTLGYAAAEARAAVAAVPDGATLPLEEKIRRALQRLGQGR